MLSNDFQLTDLINLEEWQKIQDSFAEVTSVTLRTFSPDGNLLSAASRPNRLCDEILAKASRNIFCTKCLTNVKVEAIKNIKGNLNLKCPFDFNLFVIPIKAVGENIIAYLLLGPVLLEEKKDISDYSKEAEKNGIALDVLKDALATTKTMPLAKVEALVKLIEKVFSYIAQTGYHKKRLGEIVPEVVELDPSFSYYYEKKLLSALLQACISALSADSGSVMIVDKETKTLHIKVASQLDQSVINNTEIEMGEGIAGMAAATAESIILPKDEGKNHLSDKMKRRYINSSLIVPFNKEDARSVYGVINLNITRKDMQFSDRDIQLVK
ncbi:MAG: PocR ligand-binding domain-containing protein, partial [Candidatus Omnitrophica bacterium]|nr:PocR ligand-binding domain-containing protein [Candidatus Omnitrophota bacterium]